jgi:hypothetical protein
MPCFWRAKTRTIAFPMPDAPLVTGTIGIDGGHGFLANGARVTEGRIPAIM